MKRGAESDAESVYDLEGESRAKRSCVDTQQQQSQIPTTALPATATASTASSAVGSTTKVVVWDIDETLVLFNSLMTGEQAEMMGVDEEVCKGMGNAVEGLLYDIIDYHMNFPKLMDHDVASLKDALALADPELVDAYNKAVEVYRARVGCTATLSPAKQANLVKYMRDINGCAGNWLATARNAVTACAKGGAINYAVTNCSWIATLGKLMLYGLDGFFEPERIYASRAVGKLDCFRRIAAAHAGAGVEFVAVGDGPEEAAAAEKLGWKFVSVKSGDDLAAVAPLLGPTITNAETSENGVARLDEGCERESADETAAVPTPTPTE